MCDFIARKSVSYLVCIMLLVCLMIIYSGPYGQYLSYAEFGQGFQDKCA